MAYLGKIQQGPKIKGSWTEWLSLSPWISGQDFDKLSFSNLSKSSLRSDSNVDSAKMKELNYLTGGTNFL